MERIKRKHIFLAWVLLLCMLPLSVTKIVHRHGRQQTSCCAEHHDCHGENEQKEDPCSCLICKFTLSPFLLIEPAPLARTSILLACDPVYTEKQLLIEPVRLYQLRAPPAMI